MRASFIWRQVFFFKCNIKVSMVSVTSVRQRRNDASGGFCSVIGSYVEKSHVLSLHIANEDWRHHFLKCLSVEHSIMYSTVSSNKNKAFVCPSQPLLCRSKIQTDGLLATAIQVHPHRQDLAIRSQRPILLAKEKKRESPKKKSGINFKNSGAQHQIHFRRAPNLDGSPPPPSHQITSHCIHCNSSFHRKRPVPNHGEHHRRMPPDAE